MSSQRGQTKVDFLNGEIGEDFGLGQIDHLELKQLRNGFRATLSRVTAEYLKQYGNQYLIFQFDS